MDGKWVCVEWVQNGGKVDHEQTLGSLLDRQVDRQRDADNGLDL